MQKIMIIGGPGSGKSTLARQVGARLDLPVIHMDPFYWLPAWQQRPSDETIRLAQEAAQRPAWVFEGNNSASMAFRAERADTIVFLDMPRPLRMWRILKRTIRYYGRTRPDMGAGCPERLSREFLSFCWNFDHDGRLRMVDFLQGREGQNRVIRLTSVRAVRSFVEGLERRSNLAEARLAQ